MKVKIVLGLLLFLLLAQLKRIDKTNPPVSASSDFLAMNDAPAEITKLIQNGCYDCHGHTTQYPWYTNVAPLSWWIGGHIKNARLKVNFSDWSSYDSDQKRHNIEECIEVIEENRMPAKSFRLLHPEARYSDNEKTAIITWLRSIKK